MVRRLKISYLLFTPLLALILTIVIVLGSADERMLSDLFGRGRYGLSPSQSLDEWWFRFQQTTGSLIDVIFNWKLLLFFFVSLVSTVMTGFFAWKAVQMLWNTEAQPSGGGVEPATHNDVEVTKLPILVPMLVWLRRKTWCGKLVGKLGGALAGLLTLLGLLILVTVHHQLSAAIQNQVGQRALTVAINLSDAAAAQLSKKKKGEPALDDLIGKYSGADEVAYVFITDGRGDVIAHNLPTFPAELDRPSGTYLGDQAIALFRGKQVLETRVPIQNGQLGFAYYGIWKAAIDRQVRDDLGPILTTILLVLVPGIALSIFLAWRITRPILVLKEDADRISRGDFEKPVGVHPFENFGELARSLERLRSSLNAAYVRLNRS